MAITGYEVDQVTHEDLEDHADQSLRTSRRTGGESGGGCGGRGGGVSVGINLCDGAVPVRFVHAHTQIHTLLFSSPSLFLSLSRVL